MIDSNNVTRNLLKLVSQTTDYSVFNIQECSEATTETPLSKLNIAIPLTQQPNVRLPQGAETLDCFRNTVEINIFSNDTSIIKIGNNFFNPSKTVAEGLIHSYLDLLGLAHTRSVDIEGVLFSTHFFQESHE